MGRIPEDVLEALYERAAGYCELGGAPLLVASAQRHHRKKRGSGGKGDLDTVENLLLSHGRCHDAVHRPDHFGLPATLGWDMGWMLHEREDPSEVPARVYRGLCGITGAWTPAPR